MTDSKPAEDSVTGDTPATPIDAATETPGDDADQTVLFDATDAPVFTTETPATPRKPYVGTLLMRCGAEFVGTALIVFPLLLVYTLSQLVYQYAGLMPIITVTALAYGAVSAMFGKLSGAQFNPAVTIAAMLTSKTPWLEGLLYVVAQVLGGIAAAAIYLFALPTSDSVPASTWLTMAVKGFDEASRSSGALTNAGISFGSTLAVIVELLASLVIVGVAVGTLKSDGTADKSHAWAVGLAYGLGAAIAYPVTGASLNPVHATGVALLAQGKGLTVEPLSQLWVFWIAPLFAAAIVAIAMIVNDLVSRAAENRRLAADSHTRIADLPETGETDVDQVNGAAASGRTQEEGAIADGR
ncbi:MIP/aquaporin family protein [Bifidobacterium sp. UBA744]|uniref:MIP/aquaporin family protein n=1 Tax=Bifidobacterium sp. UBA744 TaxID=1946112 RepID=UPI0025B8482D|nr:aquaporin [Bifidobacterium sp. UBA744]